MVVTRSGNRTTPLDRGREENLVICLPLLAKSGYLEGHCVCRLAQCSSALRKAATNDALWATLCHDKWPSTRGCDHFRIKGHQWAYRQLSKGQQMKQCPLRRPLPPPSCRPDQIALHINVEYKGEPVYCARIGGTSMKFFVEKGSIRRHFTKPETIQLEQSVPLGRAKFDCDQQDLDDYSKRPSEKGLYVWCNDVDIRHFDARFHFVRISGQNEWEMGNVFESSTDHRQLLESCYVHPKCLAGQRTTNETKFDLTKPQQYGSVALSPQAVPLRLRDTPLAAEIHRRFSKPFGFRSSLHLGVAHMDQLCVLGFSINFLTLEDFQCVKFNEDDNNEKYQGVTLLHILSELQGTDVDADEENANDAGNGQNNLEE